MRVSVDLSLISLVAICVAGNGYAQIFGKKSEEAKAEARAKTQAIIKEASDLVQQQKVADALKLLDQAIRAESTNPELYLARGQASLKARRIKQAQLDCETAIRYRSDFPQAYHCRGLANAYLNNWKAAVRDMGQAIKIDPEFLPAYESRAGINQGRGNSEAALEDFTKLIQMRPQEPNYVARRGSIYMNQNKIDLAMKDFDEALRLAPGNITVLQDRARLNDKLGKLDAAIADYSAILATSSDTTMTLIDRGYAYLQQKNAAKANEDFDKAVKQNPSFADVVARMRSMPPPEAQPAGTQTQASATPAPKAVVVKPEFDQAALKAAAPNSAEAAKPVVQQIASKQLVLASGGGAKTPEKVEAVKPTPAKQEPPKQEVAKAEPPKAPPVQVAKAEPPKPTPAPVTPPPAASKPEVRQEPAKPAAPAVTAASIVPKGPETAPVNSVASDVSSDELRRVLDDAARAVRENQPQKAIELYSKALSIKPDLAFTYMDRAKLYIDTKQPKLAIADYGSAVKYKADLTDAYVRRCAAVVEFGEAKDAVQDCTLTEVAPRLPEPYFYRARAYSALKDYKNAFDRSTRPSSRDPSILKCISTWARYSWKKRNSSRR